MRTTQKKQQWSTKQPVQGTRRLAKPRKTNKPNSFKKTSTTRSGIVPMGYTTTTTQGGGSVHVVHRELLKQFTLTPGEPAVFTQLINPGRSSIFPWLSRIAANYERADIRRLRFEFATTTSTMVQGQIAMAIDYDPTDSHTTISMTTLMGMQGAAQGPLYSNLAVDYKPGMSMSNLRNRFVRSSVDPVDPVNDFGKLVGIIRYDNPIGSAAQLSVGYLYASYEVILSIPTSDTILVDYSDQAMPSDLGSNANWGDAATTDGWHLMGKVGNLVRQGLKTAAIVGATALIAEYGDDMLDWAKNWIVGRAGIKKVDNTTTPPPFAESSNAMAMLVHPAFVSTKDPLCRIFGIEHALPKALPDGLFDYWWITAPYGPGTTCKIVVNGRITFASGQTPEPTIWLDYDYCSLGYYQVDFRVTDSTHMEINIVMSCSLKNGFGSFPFFLQLDNESTGLPLSTTYTSNSFTAIVQPGFTSVPNMTDTPVEVPAVLAGRIKRYKASA